MGLQEGDVLLAVNGQHIPQRDTFKTIMRKILPGDIMEATFSRKGKSFGVQLDVDPLKITRDELRVLRQDLSDKRTQIAQLNETLENTLREVHTHTHAHTHIYLCIVVGWSTRVALRVA